MDYYKIMNVVKEEIKKNELLIFTKKNCCYCVKSFAILNSLKLKYKNIELKGKITTEKVENVEFILHSLTGQKTVPNIFIKGEHIGGYTELLELHENEQIFLKLDYINCGYCNKLQSRERSCECLHAIKHTDDWGKEL